MLALALSMGWWCRCGAADVAADADAGAGVAGGAAVVGAAAVADVVSCLMG